MSTANATLGQTGQTIGCCQQEPVELSERRMDHCLLGLAHLAWLPCHHLATLIPVTLCHHACVDHSMLLAHRTWMADLTHVLMNHLLLAHTTLLLTHATLLTYPAHPHKVRLAIIAHSGVVKCLCYLAVWMDWLDRVDILEHRLDWLHVLRWLSVNVALTRKRNRRSRSIHESWLSSHESLDSCWIICPHVLRSGLPKLVRFDNKPHTTAHRW